MLPLLWFLLNTALLFLFIFLCFNTTKLIRNKYGIFASLLFIFVLLSFVKRTGKNELIKKWHFPLKNQNNSLADKYLWVELEKTILSKYELRIQYRLDKKTPEILPTEAYTQTTGWIGGTNWEPIHVSVQVNKSSTEFKYKVTGIIKWNLLGVNIYVQPKTYGGLVKIPEEENQNLPNL